MEDGIKSVEELSANSSFRRWVHGSASKNEKREWDNWICEKKENRQLARVAQQEILGITFVNSKELAPIQEWRLLENRIDQRFMKRKFSKRAAYRSKNWLLRIAAIVMLITTTAVFSYLSFSRDGIEQEEAVEPEWNLVETKFAEQKTINFSDGSSIALNANSRLKYLSDWSNKEATEVYLQGEAYFSISERKKPDAPPFRVLTADGTVEVMGTKFVVSARENTTRVVLEEGAVSISKNAEENSAGAENSLMEPNQLARFSRDSDSIEIVEIPNAKVFTSWTNQLLVLESSPFSYLVYRIEHTYGVEVLVQDSELYKRNLTGTIKLKDLEYVIGTISDVMEIPVVYTDGTVYFGKKILNDHSNP